jgi:hypothetical protein
VKRIVAKFSVFGQLPHVFSPSSCVLIATASCEKNITLQV